MALKITIRCVGCGTKLRAAGFDDFPDDCPKCGGIINDRARPEVAAPYIALKGGAFAKSVDQVYRDAERSSEARIEQAVAMTPGSTKADFNQLKITDYRSNMVEGESAVKMPEPSREFRQNIAALQGGGVNVQGAGVVDLAGQAHQFMAQSGAGPEPYAGARAMKRLRSYHSTNGVDPRMNGAVTNYPTMAERQPGYIPRA